MKKIILLVVLVALGIWGFKYFDAQRSLEAARERVQAIIGAMAANDEQTAIGLWAEDRAKMDAPGLAAYQIRFETFWTESGLSSGSGWTVTDVTPEEAEHRLRVTVQSGERRVILAVKPNQPITVISK